MIPKCRIGRLVVWYLLGVDRAGLTPWLRPAARLAVALEPLEPAAETVLAELAGIELSGSKILSVLAPPRRRPDNYLSI